MNKAAAQTALKIYTPTLDEMKQLSGDVDKLWQGLYKDHPQILSDIKEIQKFKAELKQ